MLVTTLVIVTFIDILIASILLRALFLRWGLKWAKAPSFRFRRAIVVTILIYVCQTVVVFVLSLVPATTESGELLLGISEVLASCLVACLIVAYAFNIRFLRACQALLLMLVPILATIAFLMFVVRPYFFEAFVGAANSMAPTILGEHWRVDCSECGRAAYGSPIEEPMRGRVPGLFICQSFHVTTSTQVGDRVLFADRVLVSKSLPLRRWGLVAFRTPDDPANVYVMRLVGMPDETIEIIDGSVWADGEKLSVPDSLVGIEYTTEMDSWPPDVWGSPDRPAKLGPDEYFVLGDFSQVARDSRMWEEGSPGHNSFAVPASNIVGVVTHTYWPVARWRAHY